MWSYVCRAAQTIPAAELQPLVRRLVPAELVAALHRLRGDARLGGSLNALWDVVLRILPARSALRRDEHALSKLRLARMAIVAG